MSDINDLIQHALDQDYNKANQVFGDLMGEKIADVLDQEQIKIANQLYNGGQPEEEDLDFEDEDLDDVDFDDEDLDLEDEEDGRE